MGIIKFMGLIVLVLVSLAIAAEVMMWFVSVKLMEKKWNEIEEDFDKWDL